MADIPLTFDVETLTPPQAIAAAFNDAADRLSEMIGRDVKQEFADQIANLIRQRIRSGEDREGRQFTPYSPFTAAAKGVPTVPVTLTESGDMLDAITGIVEEDAIAVRFEGESGGLDAELLMFFHQHGTRTRGTGVPGETTEPGIPARPGFGLTDQERDFIILAMQQVWENVTTRDAQATLDRML